jgi:magnesium transporter
MDIAEILAIVTQLISEKRYDELRSTLKEYHPLEIGDILNELEPSARALTFRILDKDLAVDVFDYMEVDEKEKLLQSLSSEHAAYVLNEMSSDERTEFFGELPANVVKKYLGLLSPEQRAVANRLLGYKEDTAGRLMSVEFVELKENQRLDEALSHIRRTAPDKETIYYCYVISDTRKLLGFVSLRELLLAPPEKLVRDIMHTDVIKVYTDDDQEDVARILKEYGFIAVPVVDREDRLVGIVTYDDIMDVIEEESTEDIHLMGGLAPRIEEVSYLDRGVLWSVRQRAGWLIFLIILGSFSGYILKGYQELLDSVIALAFFVPMLIDTGGNAGTQASTLVIRALATGQISEPGVTKAILKELIIGLVLGAILGVLGFFRAYFLEADFILSLAVGTSVLVVVTMSNIVGILLPFLAKKAHLDPAVMAGPVITTIVDIVGLMLYFYIAQAFLKIGG